VEYSFLAECQPVERFASVKAFNTLAKSFFLPLFLICSPRTLSVETLSHKHPHPTHHASPETALSRGKMVFSFLEGHLFFVARITRHS
jgi:sorbitol-specific phosphotransferase system component IIC